MGQQHSSVVDENTPTKMLEARTLEAVAEYIKSGKVRHMVVMTGAGISTAAGIPDFRSPATGLYANLARLNLPFAEAVFELDYFRRHPEPFYVLARELYPGRYAPTVSHVFLALLSQKGLLDCLFTQNIDCLERAAGVPADKMVEAHGSFATQRCIDCKFPFDDAAMKRAVKAGCVPRCRQEGCGGLVKPDIVFFGEALPADFHVAARQIPSRADLALVMGTSLKVHPFAALPDEVNQGRPRVLFNRERVGSFGCRSDDVLVLQDCDEGIRRFADCLGWREELEEMWRAVVGDEEAERQLKGCGKQRKGVKDQVDRLADQVDEVLRIEGDEAGHESNESGEDDLFGPRPEPAEVTILREEQATASDSSSQKEPKHASVRHGSKPAL